MYNRIQIIKKFQLLKEISKSSVFSAFPSVANKASEISSSSNPILKKFYLFFFKNDFLPLKTGQQAPAVLTDSRLLEFLKIEHVFFWIKKISIKKCEVE